MEGSDGILSRWHGVVVELGRAVIDGGDEEGVVGFRSGEVIDTVGDVEGGSLGDGEGGVRGEVEDVEAAVTEDAEVLGGGDDEAVLVEGDELDEVTIEGGFEERHGVIEDGRDCGFVGLDWM